MIIQNQQIQQQQTISRTIPATRLKQHKNNNNNNNSKNNDKRNHKYNCILNFGIFFKNVKHTTIAIIIFCIVYIFVIQNCYYLFNYQSTTTTRINTTNSTTIQLLLIDYPNNNSNPTLTATTTTANNNINNSNNDRKNILENDNNNVILEPRNLKISQSKNGQKKKYINENTNHNNNTNSINDGFAGCLLIMDDNHYLIEWLAYHYYTLPLKYLIIAVDPRSTTDPYHITQRYKTRINITIWYTSNNNTSDYITSKKEWYDTQKLVRNHFESSSKIKLSQELINHRTRQRLFYYKCIQQHKQYNRSWTILTDSDEYILLNYKTIQNKLLSQQQGQQEVYIPNITEYGSITKFINHPINQQYFLPYFSSIANNNNNNHLNKSLSVSSLIPNDTPCLQIPRRRYGTTINTSLLPVDSDQHVTYDKTTNASTSTISNNMLTQLFVYHASDNNNKLNRISKVILNLQYIPYSSIQPVDSIHRPIKYNNCTSHKKLFINPTNQLLIINHYLSKTWSEFNYRNDSRSIITKVKKNHRRSTEYDPRSKKTYVKTARIREGINTDIYLWLNGFIEKFGLVVVLQLLQNVGQLETRE